MRVLIWQLFGSFYTARTAARAFIRLGVKGSIVFTASMASYRPNKVSFPHPIQNTSDTKKQARPIRPLWRLQSRYPQHDTYPSDGMGTPQHPRQQRLSRPRQHSHDLLGAAAGGLGAAVEVLWWVPTAGGGAGIGRCVRIFIE